LALDAADFYGQLLRKTNDPDLRFRAAQAYEQVSDIWSFNGRHELEGEAAERGMELLRGLVAEFPGNAQYLAARAHAYGNIAQSHWMLHEFDRVEEPYRQAEADFNVLVARFPHEPIHQAALAGVIGSLADLYALTQSWDEAEEYYRLAAAQFESIAAAFYESTPDALVRHAGLLSNWALLHRERGEFSRATELPTGRCNSCAIRSKPRRCSHSSRARARKRLKPVPFNRRADP
jgi:tetratricopeptide (TPR) repeat protein